MEPTLIDNVTMLSVLAANVLTVMVVAGLIRLSRNDEWDFTNIVLVGIPPIVVLITAYELGYFFA